MGRSLQGNLKGEKGRREIGDSGAWIWDRSGMGIDGYVQRIGRGAQ